MHVGYIEKSDNIQNVTSIWPRNWVHLKHIVNLITEHIWITFWGYNLYVPLRTEMGLHKPILFKMVPIFYHWAHFGCIGSKHLECDRFLTAGYIGVT
jgi:hypothetical protein